MWPSIQVLSSRSLVRQAFASVALIAVILVGCAEWNRHSTEVQPGITNVSPASIPVGSDSQTLTVRGTGFLPTSAVSFNNVTHKSVFINSSQLSVQLSKFELQRVGDFSVTVANSDEAATQYLRVEGGTLEVRITGLLVGQKGDISITTSRGSGYRIYSAQTLEVPPGTYQVFGYGVGNGGSNYYSEPAMQAVGIEDGSSHSLEVSYKAVTFKVTQNEDVPMNGDPQGIIPRLMPPDL
jgi:hypothetical protein